VYHRKETRMRNEEVTRYFKVQSHPFYIQRSKEQTILTIKDIFWDDDGSWDLTNTMQGC
jgi:hypothetical protein